MVFPPIDEWLARCGPRLQPGLFAFSPQTAVAIGKGITAYLSALPEELYALFGTGYLGYTAARQWGKVKGVD